MAHLIPLHRPSGRAVWVNPEHIALLEADGDSAQLRLTTGHVAGIRETPDEILALLGLPGEKRPWNADDRDSDELREALERR